MKRKTALSEHISLAFVRFSAFMTIAALFLILGYILYNGFFYRNQKEYQVLSYNTTELSGAVFIVNKGIHIKEVPFNVLQGLFTDEYSTWKKIDSQDIDLYPAVEASVSSALPEILAVSSPGSLVENVSSAAETVRWVSATPGAVAMLGAEGFLALSPAQRQKVRQLSLRTLALAVHPSVTELKDNLKISSIEEKSISAIISGSAKDWSEFDGPARPIVLILPPEDSALFAMLSDAGYTDAVKTSIATLVMAATMDEYYRFLAETPGAAGLVPANAVNSAGLETVKLTRMEAGRNLTLDFLLRAPADSGKIGGISTIIANTFIMIILTLLFAVPPGLFAAIYLVEYAREGPLVRIIRLGTETLAGIPSIIFGLFGMLIFVQGLGWGISLISGSFTLTLMLLPTIVRTSEEALKSVPRVLQEGSFALGATRVQTIFRVVLPAAFPAVASGIILAMGRALGETAALLYTMGSNYNLTDGLFDSTRTLAVHIYLIIAEGIPSERAFASGAVLIMLILLLNTGARFLIGRMGRMSKA